jgi:hypothetical protein
MAQLPCGHWNKDWNFGEGKFRTIIVTAFCTDCLTYVSPSPSEVKERLEATA